MLSVPLYVLIGHTFIINGGPNISSTTTNLTQIPTITHSLNLSSLVLDYRVSQTVVETSTPTTLDTTHIPSVDQSTNPTEEELATATSEASTTRTPDVVPRRNDYTYVPGFNSYKVHTVPKIWDDARSICQTEGGHLAIINSIDEWNAISPILARAVPIAGSEYPNHVAMGFRDPHVNNKYVTIHGQSLREAGYDRWASEEPSNRVSQNCGAIHKDGELSDIWCDKLFGFICEIPEGLRNN